MSFFAKQTKTIIIDDENSITITKPSFGRRQDVLSLVTKVNASTQEISIDIAAQRKEMLCAWVTSWSGPGFDGLQPTKENILQLNDEIADKVLTEIDAFGGEVNDETKK